MSYNKESSNVATEKTPIDPILIHTNTSFDHLDPEYATCMSSGPSRDEYAYHGTNNQSLSENFVWTTNNQMPIEYSYRAAASCRNIGSIASGTLKTSAHPLTTLRTSYWSKFKQPRRQLTKKGRNYDKLDVHQQNPLFHGVPSGKEMSYNNDDTKPLDTEKNKISVDEECLRLNQSDILTIDANMPPEKIDIYYFDHGTSAYFLTTDIAPILLSDKCVDKIDNAATRFWAEIFGTIHIGTTFITAFILQLLRFFLRSIIRPLIVGTIQMLSDYGFKPILTIIYNGIIQPILIFLYNIATSFRDFCEPIAQAMGYFLREFTNLFRAIRVIEINPQSVTNNNNNHPKNEST